MTDRLEQPRGRALPLLPSTARLRFRTWTDADLPLARRLWADPDVMRYLHQGPYSDAQVRARLEREDSNLRAHGFQYWPMFLAADDAFVGCAGLKHCPYEGGSDAPELELGFHLGPAMWGRGLATEAALAVARVAFDDFGATRVYAGHHPENRASEGVLRKVGFRYHRHVFFEPTGLDHPLYVLEGRP